MLGKKTGLAILFVVASFCGALYLMEEREHASATPTSATELFEAIYKKHCPTLKNTDVTHEPFIICFSGTPGMGKTYFAQLLEEKYQAVLINTDTIRGIIAQLGLSQALNKIKHELLDQSPVYSYVRFLIERYDGRNKFFILDASVDRAYKHLFPLLDKQHIGYAVIRLEVARDTIIERIKNREKDKANAYLIHLDKWLADHAAFGVNFHGAFRFENNDVPALNLLFDHINAQVSHTQKE